MNDCNYNKMSELTQEHSFISLKKKAWPWEHLRNLRVISFSLCDISNVCLGFGFCLTTTPRGYFHGFSCTLPLPFFLLLLGSFFPLTTVFAPSFKAATPASELRWWRKRVNAQNFVQLTECCKSQGVLVGEKRAVISVKAKIMSWRNNRDFKIQRRGRQRERRKNNWFN